jgi:hypothetical protein
MLSCIFAELQRVLILRASDIKKEPTAPLLCLAHPERFELPTTWFVARYSIQLSYGCLTFFFGGERGIRTLDGILVPYSLSRGAPSASRPSLQWQVIISSILVSNKYSIELIFKIVTARP